MAKTISQGKDCENKTPTPSTWPHLLRRRGEQVAEQGFRSLGGGGQAAFRKRFVRNKPHLFTLPQVAEVSVITCSKVVVCKQELKSLGLALKWYHRSMISHPRGKEGVTSRC